MFRPARSKRFEGCHRLDRDVPNFSPLGTFRTGRSEHFEWEGRFGARRSAPRFPSKRFERPVLNMSLPANSFYCDDDDEDDG